MVFPISATTNSLAAPSFALSRPLMVSGALVAVVVVVGILVVAVLLARHDQRRGHDVAGGQVGAAEGAGQRPEHPGSHAGSAPASPDVPFPLPVDHPPTMMPGGEASPVVATTDAVGDGAANDRTWVPAGEVPSTTVDEVKLVDQLHLWMSPPGSNGRPEVSPPGGLAAALPPPGVPLPGAPVPPPFEASRAPWSETSVPPPWEPSGVPYHEASGPPPPESPLQGTPPPESPAAPLFDVPVEPLVELPTPPPVEPPLFEPLVFEPLAQVPFEPQEEPPFEPLVFEPKEEPPFEPLVLERSMDPPFEPSVPDPEPRDAPWVEPSAGPSVVLPAAGAVPAAVSASAGATLTAAVPMVVPAASLPVAIMSRFPTGWVMLTGVDVPGDWTATASRVPTPPPDTGAGPALPTARPSSQSPRPEPASPAPPLAPPPRAPTAEAPSAAMPAGEPETGAGGPDQGAPVFPAGLLSHLLEDS